MRGLVKRAEGLDRACNIQSVPSRISARNERSKRGASMRGALLVRARARVISRKADAGERNPEINRVRLLFRGPCPDPQFRCLSSDLTQEQTESHCMAL